MDLHEILYTIATAISVTVITLSSSFFQKWHRKRQRHKSYLAHKETQEQIVALYDIMNECINTTEADRFYIFQSHNGSGLPHIGKPYKVSALFGPNLYKDTKRDFQNIVVDQAYTKILKSILETEGCYKFVTAEEPDSLLKRIYLMEGVNLSRIYYIAVLETGMVYCSISTKEGLDSFSEADLARIEVAIAKIKSIYSSTF